MEVAAATTPTPTPASTAAAARPHELVPQLQFPPGYRFVPTEEELVDVYLRAKIEGHKLPLDVVNDVSILDWQPGKLVEAYKGYGENRWFFFTVREQSSSNKEKEPSRKVRRVPGVTATWKATGSVQLIRRRARSKDGDGDGDKAVVVGSKRVLIYNSSDANENGKWSMHEYILQDHAEIGQYALYSIQRKQHSDTEDNDNMEKKTRKRKRMETETPSAELEGVQLPHPETTALLAEPPLKPKRKPKVQRKKKPSIMQIGVVGEQQQQQQGQSPMEPVTPPKKDELPTQQEARQQPAAADGAPAPVILSAVPLQAVRVCPPSEPDGTLGAQGGTLEGMYSELCEVLKLNNPALWYPDMLCNNQDQEQWPPSLAGTTEFVAAPDTNNVVDHALFHPYRQEVDDYSLFAVQNQRLTLGENQNVYMWQGQEQGQYGDLFLWGNTTSTPQPMNSSGSSEQSDYQRHQIHHQQLQEENNGGGSFGVVAGDYQYPMMNHPQGGHDLMPLDEQSSGSDDLQVDSLQFGVQMDDLDAFVKGVFVPRDEPPRDLAAGTQEQEQEQEQEGGDDPATLQAGVQEQYRADDTATLQSQQHDDLFYYLQDGPCSCMVCAPDP